MWLFAAATTTHGTSCKVRQCVSGQELVNFLCTFRLHKRQLTPQVDARRVSSLSALKKPKNRPGKPVAGVLEISRQLHSKSASFISHARTLLGRNRVSEINTTTPQLCG
jgi:hypothetical protein